VATRTIAATLQDSQIQRRANGECRSEVLAGRRQFANPNGRHRRQRATHAANSCRVDWGRDFQRVGNNGAARATGFVVREFCRETRFWRHNPSSCELRYELRLDLVGSLGLAISLVGVRYCREALMSAANRLLGCEDGEATRKTSCRMRAAEARGRRSLKARRCASRLPKNELALHFYSTLSMTTCDSTRR
jgi:hypothetical protein